MNRVFTMHIAGLKKNESDAILEMLYRRIPDQGPTAAGMWRLGLF